MKIRIINLLSPTLLLVLFSFSTLAQDILYKVNQDTVLCKVKEIGTEEIKYSLPSYPDDLLFSIDKDKVRKIEFSNGQEMFFEKEMTNPENYIDNHKNAFKIDFLSPLTGNLTFSYERSLHPGRSVEGTLGIIGLGTDGNDRNSSGAFVKFGMKFIKSPDFYLKGMRYAHILKGSYIMPEISFGYYNSDVDYYDFYSQPYFNSYYTKREDVFIGGIFLNVGKQWVFDNAFLADFYVGAGYGFASNPSNYEYHYGFSAVGDDVPLAFTAGMKIGFLYGK